MNYKKKSGHSTGKKVNRRNDWGKVRAMERQAMNGAEHPHSVLVGNWYGAPRSSKVAADIDLQDLNDPHLTEKVEGWIPWEFDENLDLVDGVPDDVYSEDRLSYYWCSPDKFKLTLPDPPKPKSVKVPIHPKNPVPKHKHEWFSEDVTETVPIYKEKANYWWYSRNDGKPRVIQVWRDTVERTTRTRLCLSCGQEEVTSVQYDDDRLYAKSWRRDKWKVGSYDDVAKEYRRRERHEKLVEKMKTSTFADLYGNYYREGFPDKIEYMN